MNIQQTISIKDVPVEELKKVVCEAIYAALLNKSQAKIYSPEDLTYLINNCTQVILNKFSGLRVGEVVICFNTYSCGLDTRDVDDRYRHSERITLETLVSWLKHYSTCSDRYKHLDFIREHEKQTALPEVSETENFNAMKRLSISAFNSYLKGEDITFAAKIYQWLDSEGYIKIPVDIKQSMWDAVQGYKPFINLKSSPEALRCIRISQAMKLCLIWYFESLSEMSVTIEDIINEKPAHK